MVVQVNGKKDNNMIPITSKIKSRATGGGCGCDCKESPVTRKDACYHKVKSRYTKWPSAYASGALAKCRKVGAANWGNSKKK